MKGCEYFLPFEPPPQEGSQQHDRIGLIVGEVVTNYPSTAGWNLEAQQVLTESTADYLRFIDLATGGRFKDIRVVSDRGLLVRNREGVICKVTPPDGLVELSGVQKTNIGRVTSAVFGHSLGMLQVGITSFHDYQKAQRQRRR